MKKVYRFVYGVMTAVLVGVGATASAAAPIDMSTVTTEVAPYMSTAAGVGLTLFGVIVAIVFIKKAWKAASR